MRLAVWLLLLASACASPSPKPAIEAAEQAVQRAEDAEARRYAPADLARARDELEAARAGAAQRSDWIDSRRAAEKAAVDAEVAAARAAAEEMRIAVQELRRSIRETGGDQP